MKHSKEINAPRLLILGYVSIISIGTLLLSLPCASTHGISFIDALFTASSSLCVTGLIVKNTALDFTLFGKCIILALIQIGGLGYMTLSTVFFFFLGKKISFRDRLLLKESINVLTFENLRRFAWRVLRITLVLEGIGTILFFFSFMRKLDPLTAFGHAVFHAVSSFCNAGFSSFSENLSLFADTAWVPLTASALFIIGGLGFVVISDIYTTMITRAKKKFALHTILVFRTTALLIILGTLAIFLLEWNRALCGQSMGQKLLLSFFQAVTPRTAGFNTMTVSLFSPLILVMLMVFMFIGASPGGTGGGVKTTTFALLLHWIKELLLGRYGNDINTSRKRIPVEQAFRAFLIVALGIGILFVGFVLIMILDNPKPLSALFEIVSALGTVGLSMGSSVQKFCSFSHDLSAFGKLVIILVMITGRVGTITIGSALLKPHPLEYKYPQEPIAVG
jgi:trk system potassium uptake protein TrkH